jgi:multiple sugar transport system substrate-binding protein
MSAGEGHGFAGTGPGTVGGWTRREAGRWVGGRGAAGLLGVALGGCAVGQSGTPGAAQGGEGPVAAPATIQFWPTWGAQFQVDGINEMGRAFEAQTPGLTVEVTPYRGMYDKIVSAVAAGAPPDVHSLPGGQIGPFGRRGLVQALDARIAKSQTATKGRFFPAQWDVAAPQGKIVGVPAWDHHPSPYVFWNQAHFEEAGLPSDRAPGTLEEAARYAERLTRRGAEGAIERMGFDPLAEAGDLLGYWASAFDATWYDPKTRRIDLVQPGLVAALEYISRLYQYYGPANVQAYRQTYPAFNAPNAGMPQGVESMKVSSGVSTGTLANNAPSVRVGVGWVPMLSRRTYVSVGGGHFNCLASGAKEPDAGWRFVEWLTTPAANQLMLDKIGWIAYNRELATTLDLRRVPNLRFVLDAPSKAQQVGAPVTLPIETVAVAQGVQRVVRGEQGAREMLGEATKSLQTDLDQVAG